MGGGGEAAEGGPGGGGEGRPAGLDEGGGVRPAGPGAVGARRRRPPAAAKPACGGLPCGPKAGSRGLRKRGKPTGRLQRAGRQQGAGRAAGPAAAAAETGEARLPARRAGGLRPPAPHGQQAAKRPRRSTLQNRADRRGGKGYIMPERSLLAAMAAFSRRAG